VAELWLKRHVEDKKLRTAYEIRRQLKTYIYPRWADKKFIEIRRGAVISLLDDIADRHGKAMANYVLATIASITSWYQNRDENYINPIVKGMRRTKTESRDRILDDNEIRRLWQAAGESGSYGGMLKLLLLTAQRRDKVASMRWDDISDDGVWTIRTEKGEKGNPGKLKLPPLALAVIAEQPRIANSPYIFAGSLKGHFRNFADSKAELDERLTDMPHWRLHDLRRTARSLLSRKAVGVPFHIAERTLGHKIGSPVAQTYDRHDFSDEVNDALQRLAAEIERILAGPQPSNVVPLEQALRRS
jgi:integrase